MWEMYVFTGGATAQKVLNAIAIFFNSEERLTLLSILAIFALFATAIRFILTRDHNNLLAWFATALLVPSLLLTPKADMIIIDASQLGRTYTVDNVPLGVVVPAHYSTVFMQGMSSIIDKIFRMPNDQAYSTSGMLFGARLMGLSSSIGVQNAELKGIWGQYLQNCIRPDITINHKYTWNEFAQSGDVFTFLKNNRPSPLRRIGLNNDFVTCKDALPEIERRFNDEVNNSWKLIGTQSQGAKWAKDKALLKNALQNSMREFANISKTASEIMKQNIAINAVREGLYSNAASVDAVGASLNYAQTQNQSNITSTMISMGLNAKSWLPIVHSVLILLIICTSIPVFLACFIPGMSFNILKGYMGGYFYLATWPMFFTFINMIMTYSLMGGTADTLNANGGTISLSSQDQVQQLNNQFSAVAGWLMMSVPFIAAKALSGGTAMASSLMHQFSSTANSSATRNAGALASGDLGFGNLQVDNQTLSNMNANKHDMAYLDNKYGATTQRMDGTAVTQFAGGSVYNATGGISKTGFDVNSSTAQTRALQQSVADSERMTAQDRTAYNQSVSTSSDALMSLARSTSKNQSYGEGTQDTHSANLNQSLATMDSIVEEHAKATGLSKSEAYKTMMEGHIGAEIFGEKSGGLQILGTGGKVGVRGSMGGKYSESDSSSEDSSTSTTNRDAQSRQEQFNEAMGKVKQYSSNENTSTLHSDTKQAAMNFNDSYRKSEDLADNLELSHSREQSYSAALQAAQNGSLGMNTDLKQEFQEYVERYRPNNVETIMNGYGEAVRDERDALFNGFMAEKFQDYDPQLATAHDNSRFSDAPKAVIGMDLESQYNKGSEGLQTLVKGSQSDKLTTMRDNYLDERASLFNEQTMGEKRADSHDNREQLGDKVINNLSDMPEIKPVEPSAPVEKKEGVNMKEIELPKTITPF
ncbi:conjugal transfer mating-pair stabilization protein TraG [Aliivibrio fischeri]|uniref:Conjugal transfer protein TraG n=1 Tax=Aliivibrio fischeri TaxID=668 RepID=A0A510UMP3_ALIFS|nr:conjugal transfer mating-pair stabilization protein TraG [Aliivibrio fischeri]GEK15907.1 conjugal transfer protein TraG [Aliivibrio fischeri]